MRKTLILITGTLLAIVLYSCQKQGSESVFESGSCIAVAEVGAAEGSLSVSVETSGQWGISCSENWISFDVKGGEGNQAFTVYYSSNVPDIVNLRQARVAKIAISLGASLVSDTLLFVQRGFLGGNVSAAVKADDRIKLEFDSAAIREGSFICCSSEGLADSAPLRTWIQSMGADAFVLDGKAEGTLPGISVGIAGCDFAGLTPEQEYTAFREAVDATVNSTYEDGSRWILAGQMYHYSSMQTGYPQTPSWFPADAKGNDFLADRYAWQNNLYDVLWMARRDYVSTYTDPSGHSYAADYVYVSSSVLGTISSVNLESPLPGMAHKAIVLTFKY